MTDEHIKNQLPIDDELDPLFVMIIYNILKYEAKFDFVTKKPTLKTKRARDILVEEMFNLKNTSLFENLLINMIQNKLITLDQEQKKILFRK